MAATIPRRLTLAVEKLAISGDETILEIGCGRGLAVALLCSRLRGGTITAIDRSTTAIEAARKLNREEVARRTAFFYEASIEAFDGRGRLFDIVFAINVNLFRLDSAKGLAAVRRLRTGGNDKRGPVESGRGCSQAEGTVTGHRKLCGSTSTLVRTLPRSFGPAASQARR